MEAYIPNEALKDSGNEEKIRTILEKVPDGDIWIKGGYTLNDALNEIRALGEDEIADLISRA